MIDWIENRKKLFSHLGEIGELSPGTVAGYHSSIRGGYEAGPLDVRTRELIALAVAATTQCDGCITVHVAEALKYCTSKEEIAEAFGVAVAINAGAAFVYSAYVMDAVSAHSQRTAG